MNVQLPVHMDKRAFLAWMQEREERYELVEGRVIMMTRPTRGHAILVMNLASLLRAQLDPKRYSVIADFGLDAGPTTVRFPDVLVEPAGGNLEDLMTGDPVLLAEVLSPSSKNIDLRDKATEYLRLSSLIAYVVLAQDQRKAYVWTRQGRAFPAQPNIFGGQDTIELAPLKQIGRASCRERV